MDLPDVQERWPAIKQALEARGAEVSAALAVVEAEHKSAEAAPAGLGRMAGACGADVQLKVSALGADAGDLSGAEIDHQVKPGVSVGHGWAEGPEDDLR